LVCKEGDLIKYLIINELIYCAAYKHAFNLKENEMYRHYILRSYFIICLFVSALIFSCTVTENANAREYRQIIHNEFVNAENKKDQVHIAQGIMNFNFGGKEKKLKNKPKQHKAGTKKSVGGAKGRVPTRSFLEGGPLPMAQTKKKKKTKSKKLSLPTWNDK
jgi:hypothetical protein